MAQDHYRSDGDRLLAAQISGTARHHVKWRDMTADEEAAAVTELRELAAGRSDLLAQVAGVMLGFHEGDLEESRAKASADLCIKAGADVDQVAQWVAEGRRRGEAARIPPPRHS